MEVESAATVQCVTPITLLPGALEFAWLSRLKAEMIELSMGGLTALERLRMYYAHSLHFSEFTS